MNAEVICVSSPLSSCISESLNAFSFVNGELLGDEGKIEIDSLKFCIYHGQDLRKKDKIINSQKFDVFVYGHSHTKHSELIHNKKRSKLILNPG